MKLELTDEQQEQIALDWIRKRARESSGYKAVLTELLSNAHQSLWAWSDALDFAAKLCSKSYCCKVRVRIDGS